MKIWNSKNLEMLIEVSKDVLNILYGATEVLCEVLINVFGNDREGYDCINNPVPYIEKENNETYEYWRYLSYEDQKDYFENNEYLNIYTDEFYEDDRERTARNMQKIADKLGRQFTNKNSKY